MHIDFQAGQYAFEAELLASSILHVSNGIKPVSVKSSAVIGVGTMGVGIAVTFVDAGIPTKLLDASSNLLERGVDRVRDHYRRCVERGRISYSEMTERLSLITGITNYDDLRDVDIVVEAVFEEMDMKKEVFSRLDQSCGPDTILATNTSTLDIDEIAAATTRPEHVAGMHFFSPAHVMRLVEIVRGRQTSLDTVATVLKLVQTIRKIGVVVGVCDGFVGNRMLHSFLREAFFLLGEGATPEQIDKVMVKFGFSMGPFAVADLAGLDVGLRIRKRHNQIRPLHLQWPVIGDKVCEIGRLGQKTNAGWYDYESGSRTPIHSPVVRDLIENYSKELGINRCAISDNEILERCLYLMINEGANIIEEKIALRPSDIDVIWLNGYKFPRSRGGPMFLADKMGLENVYAGIVKYRDVHGARWEPSLLLKVLSESNRKFSDLNIV